MFKFGIDYRRNNRGMYELIEKNGNLIAVFHSRITQEEMFYVCNVMNKTGEADEITQEEISHLEEKLASAEEIIDGLREEVERLESSDVSDQVDALNLDIENLTDEINRLKDQNQELRRKLLSRPKRGRGRPRKNEPEPTLPA